MVSPITEREPGLTQGKRKDAAGLGGLRGASLNELGQVVQQIKRGEQVDHRKLTNLLANVDWNQLKSSELVEGIRLLSEIVKTTDRTNPARYAALIGITRLAEKTFSREVLIEALEEYNSILQLEDEGLYQGVTGRIYELLFRDGEGNETVMVGDARQLLRAAEILLTFLHPRLLDRTDANILAFITLDEIVRFTEHQSSDDYQQLRSRIIEHLSAYREFIAQSTSYGVNPE